MHLQRQPGAAFNRTDAADSESIPGTAGDQFFRGSGRFGCV